MTRLYMTLRKTVRQAGYSSVIWALAGMTDRSPSYISSCLRGVRSFQPNEIRTIAKNLDKESEIPKLFPVLGIEEAS
jgi:hypothetical protein